MTGPGGQTSAAATDLSYGSVSDVTPYSSLLAGPDTEVSAYVTHTAWWKFTAPATETVGIDCLGSIGAVYHGSDTRIDIFTGTPGALTNVDGGDDNHRGGSVYGWLTEFDFDATEGVEYYVAVSSWSGSDPCDYVLRLGKRILEYGDWQVSDPVEVRIKPWNASGFFATDFAGTDSGAVEYVGADGSLNLSGGKAATVGYLNAQMATYLQLSNQSIGGGSGGGKPFQLESDNGGNPYESAVRASTFLLRRVPKIERFAASFLVPGYAAYGSAANDYESRFGQSYYGDLGTSTPVPSDDDVFGYSVVTGAAMEWNAWTDNEWVINEGGAYSDADLVGQTSYGFANGADPEDNSTWDPTDVTEVVTLAINSTGLWTDTGSVDVSAQITDSRGRFVWVAYLDSDFAVTGWDGAYDTPNGTEYDYNANIYLMGSDALDPRTDTIWWQHTPDVLYTVQPPDWREVRPSVQLAAVATLDPVRRMYPRAADDGPGIGRNYPPSTSPQTGWRGGSTAPV